MEKSKKYKIVRNITVIIFIILSISYSYVSYRAEYLQTLEIGEEYLQVFYKNVNYKIKLFLFNFILMFLLIYINNKLIKKGLKVFFDDEKKQIPKLPNKSLALIISTILAVILTNTFFEKFILFINSAWFGINDPVFGIDIGFYLFQKPFIYLILRYTVIVLVILSLYTIAYYITVFNIFLKGVDKQLLIKSKFIKCIKFNVLLIAICVAGIIFLNTYDIVTGEFITLRDNISTKLTGAGISDITIKLWGYRILSLLIVISVTLILKNMWKQKNKKMLISISIVPAYLLGMFLILVLFNAMFINSNKLDKEKEFIRI